MHSRVELIAYQPDSLVSLFPILVAQRRQDDVVFSFEHTLAERQPQPVLEPVGFVLGRIELEFHAAMYVIHI